jgi:hypothetical protein
MAEKKKPSAKKKVIKVGVGKPYIKEIARDPYLGKDTKLKTLQNAITAIVNSKYTSKQKRKMFDSIVKAQDEQLKNKTYMTKKKKK